MGAGLTLLVGRIERAYQGVDELDGSQMLVDLSVLADDSMEGRATGTPGNARAQRYIVDRFGRIGLEAAYAQFSHGFVMAVGDGDSTMGVNIVGQVHGGHAVAPCIVVSAHFDHLGVRNGKIYNGADDNASGVAAMLAIARYFRSHPPTHTIMFVAFDAEEQGLRGAQAFVAEPPVDLSSIAVVVNLDMVSHSDSILFVAGTHYYPYLRPIVHDVSVPPGVALRFGHDQPGPHPGDDWTNASDHGPFHLAGVPFLYFGVEDHADYHAPTDDVERINKPFFLKAAQVVLGTIVELDRHLDDTASRSQPH
jgi:Zn-dependent M28 family amino/carboxypeptidase